MTNLFGQQKMNKNAFLFLGTLVTIAGLFFYISVFFPNLFSVIINFLWIMLIVTVVVFLVLGILVILGLKNEVSQFLDVLLEGSLTIIDTLELIKKLYNKFVSLLKEFVFFITPVIAAWLAIAIYILLILVYKMVGKEGDVTNLTIIITAVLVFAVGMLNKPGAVPSETWVSQLKLRFKNYFADSFEVVIFIFFLTMDSTNLFFLPEALNVPLHASIGNYDLMFRGLNLLDQPKATLILVTAGISIEILRNLLRIAAVAISYYEELKNTEDRGNAIKDSIRLSFGDAKDDLVKFITFTTVLIIVFVFFPRLKLFAMVVASVTGLVLDIILPYRLRIRESNDLVSRILSKMFNV